MTGGEFLVQNAWRGSIILGAAFAAEAALRGRTAALRHFVWSVAFAVLLVLPAALWVAPKWGLRSAPPAVPAPVHVALPIRVAASPPAPRPLPAGHTDWLPILWMVGCGVACLRFFVGVAHTGWMVRLARTVEHAQRMAEEYSAVLKIRRRARVLESEAAPMPLTWGILRPVVVLPADAADWPQARLRTVLLHELIHVQRHDLLAQVIAQAACCLFWFHPLAWMAVRRLRLERERACDDAVLRRGVAAYDYAGHLMESVRTLAAGRNSWAGAPAMAQPSDLELRVRALLDSARVRNPLSRRQAAAVLSGFFVLLLASAALTLHAQSTRGSLTGVVQDPSGARVPNCQITAKNLDGSNEEFARANPAGEYRFESIPPGHYSLEVSAPGFAVGKDTILVAAGVTSQLATTVPLGRINETLVVAAQKPAASTVPAAHATRSPQRIRVGGNVQAARLIEHTSPLYPVDLMQQGVTGTVVLRAIISTQGDLVNVEPVNTDVHPGLITAAMDAVRHWRYQPTLLNGEAVEVVTTIAVDFQLH
jgi:TonB family protein